MMFATIYLPNFSLQAALRHGSAKPDETAGQAIALIDEQEKKPVILELNTAAESAGVRKGMSPSQGLARCLSLQIRSRSALQEKAAQQVLLHHAFTLSPYVEATAPGLCTVQFTDTRNLVGKLSRVVTQLADCRLIAQAGIARVPDASFLAAHLARPVLEVDDASTFLAPLPIEILVVDSTHAGD